jgi:ferritin-like metal-binding protein YciE
LNAARRGGTRVRSDAFLRIPKEMRMSNYDRDVLQAVFVAGLKNAHGVEHQALALIDRQLDHLANYPEVGDRLRLHRGETEQQIQRLDEILGGFGETPSALKDAALSFTGNMAAIAHVFAPDEILKNSFANYAFENFEAAAYKSLITLADAGSFAGATPLLTTSLNEELAMAAWIDANNPATTLKYVERRTAGETASH